MECKRLMFVVGALGLGGIERLTVDLCLALKQTGEWEPAVCCVEQKAGGFVSVLAENGVPIYECHLTPRQPIKFSRKFACFLRETSVDLVHSHVNYSIPWQVIGARLMARVPIMFTQHNEYRSWQDSLLTRMRMMVFYHTSRPFIAEYSAVSLSTQRYLAHLLCARKQSIPIINNPVDVRTFTPNPNQRIRARAELSANESDFVVGNVASLTEQKGHIHLLQAAQIVCQKDPDVRFAIVGVGPLRETLEQHAEELGINDRVMFLGARTDAATLYNGFDCFALSSLWEGGPIVVLEAMATGIPIVTTLVGAVKEFLDEGDAQIVPIGDAPAMAEAILQLKSQPEQRARMAERALSRARNRFSVDMIADQYVNHYERILHTSRRSQSWH